jgi:geranylgeranyl pyrophosphate synthase
MRAEQSLAASKLRIEQALERFLPGGESPLFQAMRYAVLSGGKRFRPLLVLSSGACYGLRPKILLPFACALEFIHNYSLIHDDLPAMDDDDYRRGRPSCHKAFGEDIAILAGDGLLTLGFEILAGADVPAKLQARKEEAIRTVGWRAGVEGMIGGQALDISLRPQDITEAQVEDLILKKTGALITAAVEVGAILGGATRSEQRALTNYGQNIGLAFQIRDDILDSRSAKKKMTPERPDYAALVGLDMAKTKLEALIHEAVASLGRFSRKAEGLRLLAFSLLVMNHEAGHA